MAATALQNERLKGFQESFCSDPEGVDLKAFSQLLRDMETAGDKLEFLAVDISKRTSRGRRLKAFYSDACLRFPEFPPLKWSSQEAAEHNRLERTLETINAETMAATRNNPFAGALAGFMPRA